MLRRSNPADHPKIKTLLDAAFAPSTFESSLVNTVFLSGEEYHGWVAEADAQLSGFVMYTTALRNYEAIGYHLAPVGDRFTIGYSDSFQIAE